MHEGHQNNECFLSVFPQQFVVSLWSPLRRCNRSPIRGIFPVQLLWVKLPSTSALSGLYFLLFVSNYSISCGGGRNFPRWRSFEYSILQNPSSLGCWSNWGNNGCTTPSTWRVPLAAEAHLGGWCSFSARVAEEVGYLFLTFFNTWHLMAISLTESIRKQISRVKMCGAFFPCRGSFVVISCSLVCLKLMCIIHKV